MEGKIIQGFEMFTGLIRDMGTVIRVDQRGDLVVEILPGDSAFPLAVGASIACQGICLTVTSIKQSGSFTVALSAETLRCTNAQTWQLGSKINLEPSLCVGDALGGHFVSGHVDGLATVVARELSGDSFVFQFSAPPNLMPMIAPKGSVALDGVSLTVSEVRNQKSETRNDSSPNPESQIPNPNAFTVNVIAHTMKHSNFSNLSVGDRVNLEVDMLARYVARMLEVRG